VPEEDVQAQFDTILRELNDQIRALTEGGEQHA
jgi:hypothetical protein